MSPQKLAIGDTLIYPNQGLCRVIDIKSETIAGQELRFVSLSVLESGATVKVPEHKLFRNGIRPPADKDEVERVFAFLGGDSQRASLDWKKRARDNTARLSEGGLTGLAEVVKSLGQLSELRPLPPKEREQYNDARHLFVVELANALSIPLADAEDALDLVLFPVGAERPKRTIEEFQELFGDGLDADDLEFAGELSEEAAEEEPAEAEEAEAAAGDEATAFDETADEATADEATQSADKPDEDLADAPDVEAADDERGIAALLAAKERLAAKPASAKKSRTTKPAPKVKAEKKAEKKPAKKSDKKPKKKPDKKK